MQVLVMRHGIAIEREEWQGDDVERPLSEVGAKKTRQAARGLRRLCPIVDLVATSPLRRALQTAEIACRELEACSLTAWPELALLTEEDASLEPLLLKIQEAASTCSCLLLVGHEPGCSRLLSLLMRGDAGALQLDWKKAGVACVEFESGALGWFASPKMLRSLARKVRKAGR